MGPSGNAIGYNNGLSSIRLAQPEVIEGDTFYYHYQLDQVLNGWQYLIVLTSFDRGDEALNIGSLESSFCGWFCAHLAGSLTFLRCAGACWCVSEPLPVACRLGWLHFHYQEDRFYNLPARGTDHGIHGQRRIVAELQHDGDYNGSDAGWFDAYGGDPEDRVFSGGEHAWDILSKQTNHLSGHLPVQR